MRFLPVLQLSIATLAFVPGSPSLAFGQRPIVPPHEMHPPSPGGVHGPTHLRAQAVIDARLARGSLRSSSQPLLFQGALAQRAIGGNLKFGDALVVAHPAGDTAHVVKHGFLSAYAQDLLGLGKPLHESLGLPRDEEHETVAGSGHLIQHFEHGYLTYTKQDGVGVVLDLGHARNPESGEQEGKGISTILLVRSGDGKVRKGVFKPRDGQQTWGANPVAAERYYRNEILAYQLDRKYGLNMVPETGEFEYDGHLGSFQTFVESTASWVNGSAVQVHRSSLERMIAFDFIFGNPDRHWANTRARESVTAPGTKKAVAIDNGAFLPDGPMPTWDVPNHMRQGQSDPRLLASTKEFIDRFEPTQLAQTLHGFGVSKLAAEYTLRRLYALKRDPSILESGQEGRARDLATSERLGLDDGTRHQIGSIVESAYPGDHE
jgi:hypothetical protein